MKADDISIPIFQQLRDGRKSLKKIAEELNVSENTVRNKIHKLTEEKAMEISAIVNPEKITGHSMVIIGVKLATMDLVSKGEEFSKLKGVISVSVVTGRFDLIVIVLLKQNFGLLEFFTEEVKKIDQVQSVESFVVYKSYNLTVPYVF
jgi:Transcriptional regulators